MPNGLAEVTDNGTDTTIEVNGSTVTIDGLTSAQSNFTSIGNDALPIGGVGINASTSGNPNYLAIDVVARDGDEGFPFNDTRDYFGEYGDLKGYDGGYGDA